MSAASPSPAVSAERAARHWNERLEEHRGTIPDTVAELDKLKPRISEHDPHRRKKPLTHRRNDDAKTGTCVDIANYYVLHSEQHQPPAETAGMFPSVSMFGDDKPVEPAANDQPVFRIYSNAQSMGQFAAGWKRQQQEDIERRHQSTIILDQPVDEARDTTFSYNDAQREADLNFLKGYSVADKLRSMFDAKSRHYVAAVNKDQPPPIKMPVDSSHHIRRLLVLHTPDRPFSACCSSRIGTANGEPGQCQAQQVLKHPAAPDTPLIAYYSEQDYLKVCMGEELPANFSAGGPDSAQLGYQNTCEFCYRAFVAESVQQVKYNNNEIDRELPSRYYQVGPGEYSQDGMHQPAELKKATFSHGILGNMRDWNVKDFLPAMMVFSEDHSEIQELLHYDEYSRRMLSGTLVETGRRWLPGWIETGPFYLENEASLRPVKQTNPYTYTFETTARSPSVGHMLEDYFAHQHRKRHRNQAWDLAHLFWDLMRCWNEPNHIQKHNFYRPKDGQWKGFCVHRFDAAPDEETHRLYYIVLHKVNTLRRLIKPKNPLGLTAYIIQKIQVFLSSYHPLLDYLVKTEDFSDDALLDPVYPEPRLAVATAAVTFFYPMPIYHHRNGDLAHHRLAAHRYTRNNPLENCIQFYADQHNQRRDSPSTCLHRLPHVYEQADNYIEIVNYLGPIGALENYEAAAQSIKTMFVQNTMSLRVFGLNFKWKECAVKKQRKQALKQDLADNSLPEKKKEKQLRAVVRTLRTVSDSIQNNFKQVQDWVDGKTARYLHLIDSYVPWVLCSFQQSLKWIAQLDVSARNALLADFNLFASVVPQKLKASLGFGEDGVNGTSWSSYQILLTVMFRVAVLEELYDLEPHDRSKIRHNLVLLRNSHLRLFRKIFNNPRSPMTDVQLRRPVNYATTMSALDFYLPVPEREVHAGCLPDYSDRLESVDFFSVSGMDSFPWNRLHEKMPDRCCRVRDFARLVKQLCGDPTLYRWTMLVLRLSLCGLYEHCKVSPGFARSVELDELFDENNAMTIKPTMLNFIAANHDVVLNALSESLCYQLELKPALLNMLQHLYKDWFAWRIRANGDMTRYLYNVDGSFQAVLQVIFHRVHLKSMRTIFRLSETNFVIWICAAFKYADDNRHKSEKPCLPETSRIDPTIDAAIQNLILQLDPRKKIDVRVLLLFRIELAQLYTLADLNKVFTVQALQATDQEIPAELRRFDLTSKQLIAMIHSIPSEQYVVLWHFFSLLKNYQAVRTIPIRNAAILEKQWQRVQERASGTDLQEVERFAFCCAFSLCCKHVKNSWSSKPGTPSIGFEDIFYDADNAIYVCAKKPHQILEGEDGLSTTSKRKLDRELRRPICARTEPFHIFLPGLLVEADGYKIPGTKRASLNESAAAVAKAKKPTFPLPLPGYWLNPCCGHVFEYDFTRWTPAGYQCRFCIPGITMFNSFLEPNCQICHIRIKEIYYLHKVFDDVIEMRPRRMVFCQDCNGRVRRVVDRHLLLSFLLQMIADKEHALLLLPRS